MNKDQLKKCGDCGVEPGEMHKAGCDVEQCPECGGQSIGCDCIYAFLSKELDWPGGKMPKDVYNNGPTDEMQETYEKHLAATHPRMPWTGLWPGTEDCRRLDLWSYWGPDYGEQGWQKCSKDHPGASEDLNELRRYSWNPDTQRHE